KVHGRITQVGGFVIHEGKSAAVNEQVLGAEVAVTESAGSRPQFLDQQGNCAGHLRPALLNAGVERIDTKLLEGRAVSKGEDSFRVLAGCRVDSAEQPSGLLGRGGVGLPREQLLFPDASLARGMLHGKDEILSIDVQYARHGEG